MSWLDALEQIAGGVAKDVSHEVVRPGYEQGLKPAMAWSEGHGKEWGGDLAYYAALARHQHLLASATGIGALAGSSDWLNRVPLVGYTSPEDVIAARNAGGSGRAVWEAQQGNRPGYERLAIDMFTPTDPINVAGYLTQLPALRAGFEGAANIGRGMRLAEDASLGRQVAGLGIQGAARGAWGALRTPDFVGEQVFRAGTFPLRAPFKYSLGGRNPLPRLIEPGKQALSRHLHDLWRLARHDQRLGAQGALPDANLDLTDLNRVVGAPEVDPAPQSRWRQWVQDQSLGIAWRPTRNGPVKTSLDNKDVDMLVGEVRDQMEKLRRQYTRPGQEYGALGYAYVAPRRVYEDMIALHGPEIEEVLPSIFLEAKSLAEAQGIAYPDEHFLGLHPLPEINQNVSGEVHTAARAAGSAGIRAQMGGNAGQNLGLLDAASAEVASELRMVRKDGLADSFGVPEMPIGQGRPGIDQPGGLYRLNDQNVHEIPSELEDLIRNGGVGPHGLTYEVGGAPAEDAIRANVEKMLGAPLSDPEWRRIFKLGIDRHYDEGLIPAASFSGNVSGEAKGYLAGLTRQQIRDQAEGYSAAAAAATRAGLPAPDAFVKEIKKRSFYPTNYKGEIDPRSAAHLSQSAEGRATLKGLSFSPTTGFPYYSDAVHRNPPEMLPANRQELMDLYNRTKDIVTYGEKSPDFYKKSGEAAYAVAGDDLRYLQGFIGSLSDTSANTAVMQNAKRGSEEFAKLFVRHNEPLLQQLGFDPAVLDRLRPWAAEPHKLYTSTLTRTSEAFRPENFTGELLNRLGNTPKIFAFKLSQLFEARRLALLDDATIPEKLRKQIVAGMDKSFRDVVTDIWHAGAMGFPDEPSNFQHLESYASSSRVAKDLGIKPSEFQSAIWKGGKNLSGVSDDVIDSMSVVLTDLINRLKLEKNLNKVDVTEFVREILHRQVYGDRAAVGSIAEDRFKKVGAHVVADISQKLGSGGDRAEGFFSLLDPNAQFPQPADMLPDSGLQPHVPAGGRSVEVVQRILDGVAPRADGSFAPADMRTIRDAVQQMIRPYKTAFSTAWGDRIKLGYVYDRGARTLRVGLHFVVPDGEIADEVARRVDANTVFDHGTRRLVRVGEGRSGVSPLRGGKDMIELLMDAYSHMPLAQRSARTPGALGLAYQTDPLSGTILDSLQRAKSGIRKSRIGQGYKQLANRIGEGRDALMAAAESGAPGLPDVTPLPERGQRITPSGRLVRTGADPNLSDQSNEVMARTFTTGTHAGQSYREVGDDYASRIERGVAKIKQEGMTFAADSKPETWKALTSDPDAKWALGEAARLKMDPNTLDPEVMLSEHMRRLFDAEHGVDPEKLSKYKVFRTAWGQQALISLRYHAGNISGIWMQMLVGGHPLGETLNPVAYWRHILAELGPDARNINAATQLGATKPGESLMRTGIGILPGQISRTQAEFGATGASSRNALGKVSRKIFGPRLGDFIGKVADINAAVAGGVEVNGRGSVFTDVYDTAIEKGEIKLRRDIAQIAQDQGLDPGQILAVQRRGQEGVFHVPTWREDLIKAGLKPGQAEQVTRKFLNMRNEAFDQAIKEVNRIHFSYDYTNLDEFVSKFIPFHYWASRATRFYVEETLRHPFYLYKYAQMREGMDRVAQDPGLDARSQGFVKLMDGPHGFSLLMNPEGLLGVAKLFDMDTGVTPDGETRLGAILRIGKQHGVNLFPWMDAALNYMGVYGDTFPPDPAGLRTRQLVGAAVNYARANFGMEPAPAPYEAANTKLREWISSLTDSLAPGWIDQPVMAKSSEDGTMARANLDDIITSRILADNPNLTNGALLDILNDPNSPEYDKAWKQAASAGLLQQVLSFTVPTTTKVRENSADVARAKLNVIRAAAAKAGVSPDEYVPTLADTEFLTAYKNKTGEDFKPGQVKPTQLQRDLAQATPGSRAFVIAEAEYNSIGTPEGQAIKGRYQEILDGVYTPPELGGQNLPPAMRAAVAEEWLRRHDRTGAVAQIQQTQRQYRDTHPEFDTFKQWQSQMYNLTAAYGDQGLAHYRDLLSQTNPSAARYFANLRDSVIRRNPGASPAQIIAELDRGTTNASAWMAATGRSENQMDPGPLPTGGPDPATQLAIAQQQQQGSPQYGTPPGPGAANWITALNQYG